MTHAQPEIADSLHCPQCGYNLFGIDSGVCRECGLAIDRTDLGISRIPWSHRHKIGFVRAFLRTNWLAMVKPRVLGQEINRPVSLDDARAFRRVCVAMGWLGLMFLAVQFAIHTYFFMAWERIAIVGVSGVAAWLFLLAGTGFPGHFFHPASMSIPRQNRAIALSYYSAAAIAWLLPPLSILGLALLIAPAFRYQSLFNMIAGVVVLSSASAIGLFVVVGGSASALLKSTTGASAGRQWVFLLSQCAAWFGFAVILLAGIPLVALFLAVVINSLRGI